MEYDDSWVDGVFSTKERAKDYITRGRKPEGELELISENDDGAVYHDKRRLSALILDITKWKVDEHVV